MPDEAIRARGRELRRIPLAVSFGLAAAIALDTAIQLLAKLAIASVPAGSSLWEAARHLVGQKIVLVLAILTIGQLINWLRVLQRADLSFALPITSLSYVSVCVLSKIYFAETLGPLKVAGVASVLLGVWCVSRTSDAEPRQARAHT